MEQLLPEPAFIPADVPRTPLTPAPHSDVDDTPPTDEELEKALRA